LVFVEFSDAFDMKLLLSTMEKLKCGQHVDIPNYDFKHHKRIEAERQVLLLIWILENQKH